MLKRNMTGAYRAWTTRDRRETMTNGAAIGYMIRAAKKAVEEIVKTARAARIPVMMKRSKEMEEIWGKELIQELPVALSRPEDKPIPHCSDCEHHRATERYYNERHGKTIMNHFCVNGDEERKAIKPQDKFK